MGKDQLFTTIYGFLLNSRRELGPEELCRLANEHTEAAWPIVRQHAQTSAAGATAGA